MNCASSASFARQVAKDDGIEKYTREYNYPKVSRVISGGDLPRLGLKTFFFSDAASAVNTKVFKELNGYDGRDLPTSEDMYLAYKLITSGHKIKYVADAQVFHSHDLTLRQLYDRYFLTGQFLKLHPEIAGLGAAKAGGSLAKYILKRALSERNFPVLFGYLPNMSARYLGLRSGRRSHD